MKNNNITPELIEKAKGKTTEEIIKLAEQEGIELTDEHLEAVSGGWTGVSCPYCGNPDTETGGKNKYHCSKCGRTW